MCVCFGSTIFKYLIAKNVKFKLWFLINKNINSTK